MENPTNTNPINKPNIIFITVDQMRFPMHFPAGTGVDRPDKFIETYMPNLWTNIWEKGVKFHNHYTAASDCTAGRATIYTGLYAYQTYSMLTLITYPPNEPQQPQLHKDFPTIGKLMMQAGYDTPYFGKWHLSYDPRNLNDYGFQSHVPEQDYVGYAGQGMEDDATKIATAAAAWVTNRFNSPNQTPYFCPVNFINPHDQQWFWGGMQANYYNYIYDTLNEQKPQTYDANIPIEDYPPPDPYTLPIGQAISNWQSQSDLNATNKPSTQTLIKEVFQYNMGGIFEADREPTYTECKPPLSPDTFWYAPTDLIPGFPKKHKTIAAPRYWTSALNSYILVMRMVDQAIGVFMDNIPSEVKKNTIFIFTSDHGEYGSSHGLHGKGGTVYEEGIRVPLVVYDPTGVYTKFKDDPRNQLTSSVDLLPMIVTMGYGGDKNLWMRGEYKELYDKRCDLLPILGSPVAEGREYALHSTDEFIAKYFNYLDAPLHVIGQISMKGGVKKKLGVYTTWSDSIMGPHDQATVVYPQPSGIEFYNQQNYANPNAPLEVQSLPTSAEAQAALVELFGGPNSPDNLHTELMAPLPPGIYRAAQAAAYNALISYMNYVNTHPPGQSDAGAASERTLARAWAY